jgi:restriction system protein
MIKIILIDGKQLTEYMIDKNVGVAIEKSYSVKKLDHDYLKN